MESFKINISNIYWIWTESSLIVEAMNAFRDPLFRNIVEGFPLRVFWKDIDSRYLGCNSLFAMDAGLANPDDLVGKTDFEMGWKDQAERYVADDRVVMTSGIPRLGHEEPLTTGEGRIIWIRTSKVPLRNAEMEIIGVLGLYEDITAQKAFETTEAKLIRALKLLSKCNTTLIHAGNEQDLLSDICRLAVEAGGYLMAWVGFAEDDAGKTVRPVADSGFEAGYLDSVNVTWADTERGRGPTGKAIRTGKTQVNQNWQNNPFMAPWREEALKRGYQSSIALPLVDDGKVLGALTLYAKEQDAFNPEEVALLEELASDLAFGIRSLRMRASHEAAMKELDFLARHDSLTGLSNRILLRERFGRAAADLHKSHIAILLLDIDNFKQVNDSLGHSSGDRVLVQVARRLQGCVREADTISRQGGDEFIIMLAGISDAGAVETIARSVIDAFAEPFSHEGHMLNLSCSMGISLFPDNGREFDILFQHADAALYQAKDAGRNIYRFFTEKMNADVLEQVHLQGQLRKAIAEGQFLLHYQPRIDTASGRVVGAEVLIRWQHPEMGMVYPAKFIPFAERSGLIVPIGEWVLKEACRQCQSWREEHHISLSIAVNLCALQFKRGNIVQLVRDTLRQYGFPADCLELELTESILLHDVETVMKTLQELKEIGVKLSIDDFGTGYSSLSYLKRLSVDKLKIDQSFVSDMVSDPGNAAIVKAIIQLGQTLQLETVAEGVESDAQLALLKRYGCTEVQGYLFSRPIPAEEFVSRQFAGFS